MKIAGRKQGVAGGLGGPGLSFYLVMVMSAPFALAIAGSQAESGMLIRVYNYADVPRGVLTPAKTEAQRILSAAGVDSLWLDCSLTPPQLQSWTDQDCGGPFGGRVLVVQILPGSTSAETAFRDTVFGFAEGDSVASVFYGRITDLAQGIDNPDWEIPLVLGAVIAHEIGHLLLGPYAHSLTGIMCARWSPREIRVIARACLLFTDEQADLLRLAVQSRIQGQNATGFARTQSAGEAEPSSGIKVRVYNYAAASHPALAKAEEEASRIFREAGVELAWLDCPTSHAEEEKYPACQLPLGSIAVDVRILSPPMAARVRSSGEELGFALPSVQAGKASAAWVDYGRAERLAESQLVSCDQILGHALAHEIGHLLLGPNSHSQKGIMRANWDRRYLEEASRGQLLFTGDQARLIRADMQVRVAMWEASQVR